MELPLIGKVKHPSSWLVGLLAAGILATGSTTFFLLQRTAPKIDLEKLTVPVQSETLKVRITANGTVVPVQSVNLSPKSTGRLAELYVEQGDRVQQGQKIALMENTELQAQLAQAKANLEQVKARLAQAVRGSRSEEISQAKARLARAEASLASSRVGRPEEIAQAKARLAQAEATLTSVRSSRPEEIAQTEAQITAARARADLARTRLERNQDLANQGAISRDQLDEVQTEYRNANANLREVQRRLEQLKTSTRQEIEQRQAAVSEARSALQQAQRGSREEEIAQRQADVAEARAALEQMVNGTRPEEIQGLKAEVEASQAQVKLAETQLNDTLIRAPFTGVITQKYATEGAFVAPTTSASSTTSATSTSIVALAKDLEILAEVPEVDVGQIKQGQQVEIVADAYPDQVFKGTVRLIAPEAVVEQNVTSFQVRLKIVTGKEQLRSGMNVDVTFLGQQLNNALVVPTVAIVTEKGKTGVMVPGAENKPQFRPVTIGPSIQNQTQILEGVKQGERVFIDLPKDSRPKPEE